MAKPAREKGGSSGGSLDNPGRKQDVQGLHKDAPFYVTKGGIMTPVALHAQGTIKPAPLHDRGYNKEPGDNTFPSSGAPTNKGGTPLSESFGLKGGK